MTLLAGDSFYFFIDECGTFQNKMAETKEFVFLVFLFFFFLFPK